MFILKFSFKDMNFKESGQALFIFNPDNLEKLGWTRSHCETCVDDKVYVAILFLLSYYKLDFRR